MLIDKSSQIHGISRQNAIIRVDRSNLQILRTLQWPLKIYSF